jgi:hypothetical protein
MRFIHNPRSTIFNLSAQRGRWRAGVYGKRALPMIEGEGFGGTDLHGAGDMEHVHGPAAEPGRLRAEEAEGVHEIAALDFGETESEIRPDWSLCSNINLLAEGKFCVNPRNDVDLKRDP